MRKNNFFVIVISIFLNLSFLNSALSSILEIGNEDAKITVKVFSSLTCPHCASFHNEIFKNLKKEYIERNKVKFEHHAFPLDLAALNAEKIVRCGVDTNQKFKLLEIIYKKQKDWAVGSDINKINQTLIKIGTKFQLDEDKLKKCLNDEKSQDIILKERIEAQKNFNITSTPTIYINDKKMRINTISNLLKSI